MTPLDLPIQMPGGAEVLALLTRIAAAVEETGKKSEEASQKTATGWERAQAGINAAADSFNEARAAVTGFAEMVSRAVDALVAGAEEAAALSDRARELGVDFDEAAESAGRFLDETSAMGAANEFAARGVRLTQTELNALARVAGATSQQLRITTEEGVERLTAALMSGRGRALAPFGAELTAVAGTTHTMEQRLAALVSQADKVEPAVDNAADSVNRFKDSIEDMQREFASGFVEGIREMERLRVSTQGSNDEVTDLNVQIRALGSTAAEVVSLVGNGVGVVLGAIGMAVGGAIAALTALGVAQNAILDGNIRGAGSLATAAFERSMVNGLANDSFNFLQDRVASLEAIAGQDDTQRASMPAPAAPAAGPGNARGTRGALGGTGGAGGGGANDHPDGITIGGAASAILDRMIAEARTRQTEERAADTARRTGEAPTRANAAQERDRREAQEHERGQAAIDRLRGDQDREKATEREKDDQAKRLENLHSFNGQWRQLHSEQVNVAASAAQSLSNTFGSLGAAMGEHFYALVAGQETLAAALQGILSDTLDALAKEAYAKGGFYFAEGLARLVMYDFPGAATSFGASVAYFAAGAGAQALGAAVAAPAQPSAGGGSAGTGRGAESFGRPSNDTASSAGPTIVHHYYAPVIGGRDALDSEVGQRMGRYTDAASQRQVRDRGGAGRRAA